MPRKSSYSSYSSYLQNKTVTYGCPPSVEITTGGTGGSSGPCVCNIPDPLYTNNIINSHKITTQGLQVNREFLFANPQEYPQYNLDNFSTQDISKNHPHVIQMWHD